MLLDVKELSAGYQGKPVIFDISLSLEKKEIVGIIGHNGAGKSTLLKAIFGLVKPMNGSIAFEDREVIHNTPQQMLNLGVYHIPQDNYTFSNLSVGDNLELSLFTKKSDAKTEYQDLLKEVYKIFPKLKERHDQLAGTLSGGERRMLSIGMGLLRQPKLLMLDEPSSGLSPAIFDHVIRVIQEINQSLGTTILLVEQNVKTTFKVSDRVYVMKAGKVLLEDTGPNLLARGEWWDLF